MDQTFGSCEKYGSKVKRSATLNSPIFYVTRAEGTMIGVTFMVLGSGKPIGPTMATTCSTKREVDAYLRQLPRNVQSASASPTVGKLVYSQWFLCYQSALCRGSPIGSATMYWPDTVQELSWPYLRTIAATMHLGLTISDWKFLRW